MYLEKINGPEEIKKIEIDNLQLLADEVRNAVINRISKIGGHKGPNLGMVEMTVALHYVFNSPYDKIVFDVSHQCYPHKILTGRKDAYIDDEKFNDVTGYTNPNESEHDFFTIGHTSTSVSLALGLAKGRDLNNGKENIIAVIGDGSLSGGEALEAIDYAGEYDKNLIIIVNDNDQFIAENHGGLYKNLKELRDNNGIAKNNLFEAMGLEYRYIGDGHDIKRMIEVFNDIKDIDHPIVIHIHTIKGKGLKYAEENREAWHSGAPFIVEDGSPRYPSNNEDTMLRDSLVELLESNNKAVVLGAGTAMGMGFTGDVKEKYMSSGQFIDVGIAEENAVAMASGIAKNGGTPVFGTYAPFFQRTYDQMSHDVCLNNQPATFLLFSPGVYGMNSNTHIALCDIQMFAHIPNLTYLAPSTKEEYQAMFKYATTQRNNPVAIRVQKNMKSSNIKDEFDYSVLKNKIEINGEKIAIFAVGILTHMALEVANKIKQEKGLDITVINPLFLNDLDVDLLEKLKENHKLIITIEDGELQGGYGQTIASYYGNSNMKVINHGISKKFHTDFKASELLDENGISVDKLYYEVIEYLK